MPHKIFLSHNYHDKPIVEQVALRLADIFGQDQVFYDSWSIQPGDGIIDQMNQGLEAPELVLFFVSANSLSSGMVKLEWQNALYAASKGKTRIVPVRVDATPMPALLTQTLFIDMQNVGLEAALHQIVKVAQGDVTFTPQHLGFSNITASTRNNPDGSIDGIIRVSHLMEPNPSFLIVTKNVEGEFDFQMNGGQPTVGGFNLDVMKLGDGSRAHALIFKPLGGALTVGHPIRFTMKKKGTANLSFFGVMHQATEDNWVEVPANPAPF